MVLEKTPENPLGCKAIKPVNPKRNQSWIFFEEDWSRSWSSNTLATWLWRADSLERTMMLGKNEDKRRGRQPRMRMLDSITDSVNMNLRKFWEIAKDRETWCAAFHGVTKDWIAPRAWTTTSLSVGERYLYKWRFFCRCKFLFQNSNLTSVFRTSPVSALFQNNPYGKKA